MKAAALALLAGLAAAAGSASVNLLFDAAESGDWHAIDTQMLVPGFHQRLIQTDSHDRTPFVIALRAGHQDVALKLVPPDKFLSKPDEDGWTALDYAAAKGLGGAVSFLIGKKVALERPVSGTLMTPLLLAAAGGHAQVVGYLLSAGAEVNAKNADGDTALHLAAAGGHAAVVEALLARRPNLEVRNKAARTALDLAEDREVVRLLSAAGAQRGQ